MFRTNMQSPLADLVKKKKKNASARTHQSFPYAFWHSINQMDKMFS